MTIAVFTRHRTFLATLDHFHLILDLQGVLTKRGKYEKERREEKRNDRDWQTTFAHGSRENEIETIKVPTGRWRAGLPLFLKDFRPRGELL